MVGKRGYIAEFDGMRGIAISLVMLYHIWRYSGDSVTGQAVSAIGSIGWSGVDLFFVLSGFLITGILLDTRNAERYWRKFYIRRSLRIFPIYYAVMTALVVAGIVLNRFNFGVDGGALLNIDRAWINFLYLTDFYRAFKGPDYVPLDIAWSLAVEEQYYLIYPFIVRWASIRTLAITLIAAIALAPVLRFVSFVASGGDYGPPYVLPYCRMDTLAMGGLAMLLVRESSERLIRAVSAAALPLALAAIVMLSLWGRGDTVFVIAGYSVVSAASMAVMVRVFMGHGPILAAVFRQPVLVYIGKISYGLYLLHLIARAIVDMVLGGSDFRSDLDLATFRLAAVVVLAVVLASISYYGFERPLLRLKDRFAPALAPAARAD